MKDKELYVLLDTSFLINLVSERALFHERAYEFFNSFMTHHYVMAISTIAISEYAIKDDVTHLP
jgi:predicted nucleic acid-binding protein